MYIKLQRWAHAYRDLDFHRSVDTHNGTEALNKVLKYGYLPKRHSLTLSDSHTPFGTIFARLLPEVPISKLQTDIL